MGISEVEARFEPTLAQGLVLVLLVFVAGFALAPVGRLVGLGNVELLEYLVSGVAAPAAVLWLGVKLTERPWRDALPFRRVAVPAIAWFLVAQAGATALVLGLVLRFAPLSPPPESLVRAILRGGPIAVVVGAPVVEELLCRGLLLSGLLRTHGRWVAILGSAVLFAGLHMNPWQAPVALLLGVLYAYAAVMTRSLWLPIFGHMFNNCSVLFGGGVVEVSFGVDGPGREWLLMAVGASVLLFGAYRLGQVPQSAASEDVLMQAAPKGVVEVERAAMR